MSCQISLPTLALLGYLSLAMSIPIIITVGGPGVFILEHIMLEVEVYLLGRTALKRSCIGLPNDFCKNIHD
jgi:hypothetical protein